MAHKNSGIILKLLPQFYLHQVFEATHIESTQTVYMVYFILFLTFLTTGGLLSHIFLK